MQEKFASTNPGPECPHRFFHLYAVHDDAVERVLTYECDACPAQYSCTLDKETGTWTDGEIEGA